MKFDCLPASHEPSTRKLLAVCVTSLLMTSCSDSTRAQDFDLIIRNGTVVDGTGNAEFQADVGIVDDTIVAVREDLGDATAERIIDASSLYVSPGFIDLHSHADRGLTGKDPEIRKAEANLRQGIATVVGGPDGRNRLFPMTAEFAALRSAGIGINFVPMVGHGTVRGQVMKADYERPATSAEVERMQALVRDGMEAGAWGLGTGLEYRPGRFSDPDEVVALAQVVAEYGGFHFSHMRGSGVLPKWQLPSMVDSFPVDGQRGILEIINIARVTGIPSVASHVKAKGRSAWGRSASDILFVDLARAEGLPVYMDQYPYEGHSGSPAQVTPNWALVDPGVDASDGLDSPVLGQPGALDRFRENLLRNMTDPATRERLRFDTEYAIDFQGGPDRIFIVAHPDESIIGKTVAEVAALWDLTPEETIWAFTLEGFPELTQGALLRPLSLHAADVENYMRQDYTATSSDGELTVEPGDHPRHFGAFARKISYYVRDHQVISLPHAIRSSSGLPAQIIGLADRGFLQEGYKADIVIFNLQNFRDRSTPMNPERMAEGVMYMVVNGVLAIDDGSPTGALAGRIIERNAETSTRSNKGR